MGCGSPLSESGAIMFFFFFSVQGRHFNFFFDGFLVITSLIETKKIPGKKAFIIT